MAKEYIEREELIDEINIAPVSMSICMNVDECKGRIYERERLVRIINDIPAADVVPVRHGRWKPHSRVETPVFHCSVCGGVALHAFGRQCKSPFCPSCGAKMDKDGDGE